MLEPFDIFDPKDTFESDMADSLLRKKMRGLGMSREQAAWAAERQKALNSGKNISSWMRKNPPPGASSGGGISVGFVPARDRVKDHVQFVDKMQAKYGRLLEEPAQKNTRTSADLDYANEMSMSNQRRRLRELGMTPEQVRWDTRRRVATQSGNYPLDEFLEMNPAPSSSPEKGVSLGFYSSTKPKAKASSRSSLDAEPRVKPPQSKLVPTEVQMDVLGQSLGSDVAPKSINKEGAARASKIYATISDIESSVLGRDPETGGYYQPRSRRPRLEDPDGFKWGHVDSDFHELRSLDKDLAWKVRRYQIKSGLAMQKAAARKLILGDHTDIEKILREGRAAVSGKEPLASTLARMARSVPGKFKEVSGVLQAVKAEDGLGAGLREFLEMATKVIR